MKAIIFESKHNFLIKEHNKPNISSGEVLVKTKACGLCHTDLDILAGNYGTGAYPIIPGHEYSGIIEAVAEDVTHLKIGDRVVIDPNISCGHCRACQNGLFNICDNLEAYGVTKHGGFAEYSVVDHHNIHLIKDLPFDVAALAEPLACVLNALGVADTTKVRNTLILGAGPMGLLLGLSLHARNIADVTMVDIQEPRLAFAQSLGFKTRTFDSLNEVEHEFDFTIDATGIPSVAEKLIRCTSNGGTILFYGVCPQDARIEISPFEIFRRQLKIVGSHSLNKNIPDAIKVIEKQRVKLSQLVSAFPHLQEIQEMMTSDKRKAHMKIQWTESK